MILFFIHLIVLTASVMESFLHVFLYTIENVVKPIGVEISMVVFAILFCHWLLITVRNNPKNDILFGFDNDQATYHMKTLLTNPKERRESTNTSGITG